MKKLLLVFLLVIMVVPLAMAQQRTVSGTVTDGDTGEPLPSVTVIIKGTTTGTSTDVDGKYQLAVPSENSTLVYSFIGMISQEIVVGSQAVINVAMEPDMQLLDEVVVTGYGTIKKTDMTSAHATIDQSQIEKTVNTTIEQAIQGRAAGVYVTQNTGQPGGGISVNIRGVNSINGSTQPLYVIDGVQIQGESAQFGEQSSANPLAGINPSDIASMEVLQGPSATALYGSRATNGVIVITTKRGKAGATQVSYGFQYSLQTEPEKLEVMNLQQYARMVKEYHDIAGGTTPEEFLDPSILGEGTDWQEELFTSAAMLKHQLSMRGGNENTRYYLSGEYLTQDGIALGSGFDRYSVRLNLDNEVNDWLNFGANLSFNQTDEQLTTNQENIISNGLQLSPNIPVKNFDGTYAGGNISDNPAQQFIPPNPVGIASITTNDLKRRQFLGGLDLNVKLLDGLTFRTSLNTNLEFFESTYFLPKYKFGYQENPAARLLNRSNSSSYWRWSQALQYYKEFGKHKLDVLASHESQESQWKNLSAGRSNFVVDDLIDLELGDINTATNGGGQGDWAMESYLARVNYNYGDRYLVMAAFRADASVNFGDNNKWGYFPSISAAWRVSEEAFFNVPAISELKLRLETGLTGNQGSGSYIYGTLGAAGTPWGTGFMPNRYPNPDLQWEETLTKNIGLNLGLLENRIQLELDYYIKNTDNLLLENPLPWYMGNSGQGSIASPFVNIGELRNEGWGITLNTINIDRGGFQWKSNFNISHFETTIEKFYNDNAAINRTSWWLDDWTQRSVVGESPWLFVGYLEEGIFETIDEIENSALPVDNNGNELAIAENSIWIGDVKYKDISGPEGVPDGIIDVHDQTFIGNPWPELFLGFTNTFTYKNFDLSILITGTYGNDIYNHIAYVNSNPNQVNLSRNMMIEALNYARIGTDEAGNPFLENPGTSVPRITANDENGNFDRHTNRFVEDGSFLRVKNITLSYSLPASLLGKVNFIKGIRASVSGQNLFTLTNYSGYDPEVGSYVGRDVSATNQAIGLDNGRYPLTPVYSFQLQVDF